MKKFIHALILFVFTIGCLTTWAVLSMGVQIWRADKALPSFTLLCSSFRPVLLALPIVAAIYCLWVWFRKADRIPSWMGFFAATMGTLVLVAFPAMLGAYLPLLFVVNFCLPHK